MKTKKQKNKTPITIAIIVIVVVITTAVAVFFITRQKSDDTQPEPENSQSSDKKTDTDNTNLESPLPSDDQAQKGNPEPTVDSGDISVSIPFSNVSDGLLQISSHITPILSSGTCHLTLTKDEVTITRESNVANLPSISTCQGFTIPVSELSPGTWQITLQVTSGNKTGLTNTETRI